MGGQVGDSLIRCERDRLVACEVFELLTVCLNEMCNAYARFTATVERRNCHLPDNLSRCG